MEPSPSTIKLPEPDTSNIAIRHVLGDKVIWVSINEILKDARLVIFHSEFLEIRKKLDKDGTFYVHEWFLKKHILTTPDIEIAPLKIRKEYAGKLYGKPYLSTSDFRDIVYPGIKARGLAYRYPVNGEGEKVYKWFHSVSN